MKREDLQTKTVKDLRDLAKTLNIVGRWDMNKTQLIDAILETEKAENSKVNVKEKATKNIQKNDEAKDTDAYVLNAAIGTLVAFKIQGRKPNTGKIVKRSVERRMLLLETQYGKKYKVPFADVLWVKTGERWPRGVYNLLKGKENAEKAENI